jgi:hypothetical protein
MHRREFLAMSSLGLSRAVAAVAGGSTRASAATRQGVKTYAFDAGAPGRTLTR